MKKIIGIALITLGLTSCSSTDYVLCPAEQLVANCENCDEID